MRILDVKNRVPFLSEKGERLRALSHLTVFLPKEILDAPGTRLGEIIQLSNDDADMGVTESAPGVISAIIVAMKPGDEISLGRSTEIAVDDVPEGQAAFESLD
jgi:hypothetical protein